MFASKIAASTRAHNTGGTDMPDGIRWVGLDVHARESTLAVFDQATGEVITKRVVGRPHELLPWLRDVPRPARMVYEAGLTGYGLARRALAEGLELGVCAPGKTERPPQDRVKTDKRDAIRLARLLAAGELTLVTIPSVEREQLRDLVRCREDIRVDLSRARHRIGGFLLRREIYWEGTGEAWTRRHRSWLTSIRFADHASQATLADYLHAHDVLIARRDQVEADLAQLAVSAPCAHTVARLRCLRGIDTLTAVGLCSEIGEWERFDHPDQLSAYLGIVPSEHTTGQQRRLGSITKAGSTHARRLLIEAGLPLPPRPRGRRGARASPTRASTRDHQHLLARATPTQTPAGANSKTRGANPAGSSRSRSPASSPATAQRSPPARPQRRNRRPHQPPARGSPTHAEPPNPLRLTRRPERSRLAHTTPRFVA
jgi:transposase